jgi:hypothetical protein
MTAPAAEFHFVPSFPAEGRMTLGQAEAQVLAWRVSFPSAIFHYLEEMDAWLENPGPQWELPSRKGQ